MGLLHRHAGQAKPAVLRTAVQRHHGVSRGTRPALLGVRGAQDHQRSVVSGEYQYNVTVACLRIFSSGADIDSI